MASRPDQDAYDREFGNQPEWAESERGRIEGFYDVNDYWVEWKDDAWRFTDGTTTLPPDSSELQHSDLITVAWTNASGDLVYATLAGGLDGDYDLDEAIHDMEERDSGTPQ